MLDSGCTQHMTGDSCMFKSIDTSQNGGFDAITFGNNKKGKVKEIGYSPPSSHLDLTSGIGAEAPFI